jgi:uncharacterized protein (DUF427 family)
MKLPGPDHPITIAFNPKRVEVVYSGHTLADSRRALELKEASYHPAQYIPREDVDMAYLTRTDHHTYCPYKGEASYYSILMDGVFAENAVWTYEDPYPAMAEIKDHLAFYPNKVDIRLHDDAANPSAIRDAIEHTDSGSGSSQLEHAPPNVSTPGE